MIRQTDRAEPLEPSVTVTLPRPRRLIVGTLLVLLLLAGVVTVLGGGTPPRAAALENGRMFVTCTGAKSGVFPSGPVQGSSWNNYGIATAFSVGSTRAVPNSSEVRGTPLRFTVEDDKMIPLLVQAANTNESFTCTFRESPTNTDGNPTSTPTIIRVYGMYVLTRSESFVDGVRSLTLSTRYSTIQWTDNPGSIESQLKPTW